MALPRSRKEFAKYCLRELGAPVVEINIDEEQVEDRIDEALKYYFDYHFDGTEKTYYKHQVTQEDIDNKYIDIPENIIGVVNIFPVPGTFSSNNLFDIRYQIALNDLYSLTNVSLVPYVMYMQHIRVLEEILVGQKPIRYNRHRNRLHIDMDWKKLEVGEWLIAECYEVVDPEVYQDVWNDRWLLRYATQLIKRQWGTNLKKFTGMVLPGGIQFNGQVIYDEANAEIKQLEQEMIRSYSLPVNDMFG